MRVIIRGTAHAAQTLVADLLADQLQVKPRSVLGLATGETMESVYVRLVEHHKDGRCSFGQARSFNLDEYLGISENDPQSYRRYMEERLFEHVDMPQDGIYMPGGDATDPHEEAVRYEKLISLHGPIDIQLLGLGSNGHIGFNEPASEFTSRTRVVSLSQSTIEANGRYFGPGEHQPTHALTMGIATILQASRIVLLAVGKAKAEAVARTVEGAITSNCPSTILQTHRDAVLVVDEAAAANLTMSASYRRAENSFHDL